MNTTAIKENRSPEMAKRIVALRAGGWRQVKVPDVKLNNADVMSLFEDVQNSTNWKCEMSATVEIQQLGLYAIAIEFFTSSETYFRLDAETGNVEIFAPGYYETIGA